MQNKHEFLTLLKLALSLKKSDQTAVQMFRYFIIAGMATLLDYGIFLLALKALSLHYTLSIILGFAFGVSLNYLISIQWAFESNPKSNKKKDFSIFILTGIVGILINIGVVAFLFETFSIDQGLGRIPAIAVAFLWNFYSKKWFVFKN